MAKRTTAKADRTKWFREAKFGLFIHWGVYSLLGKGEWIQHVGKIPVEKYEKLYPKFNPTKFNADAWVKLAKRAGMKYITMTTKHHDGFCMFDSKRTDYDITNTPLQRDIIGEVTRATRKAGLKMCYYYSIMDWHHPDYLPRRPWEEGTRSVKGAKLSRYLDYMKGQLRELCTNYGKIACVWYDGGWEHTAKELDSVAQSRMIRRLQPGILINDRAQVPEDFGTPEQRIPPTGLTNDDGSPRLWEACITMTSHWWGYDRYEKTYKSTDYLIRRLVDLVSKGGNLLLNVGPKPDGTIQQEFVERLEAIGRWMRKHGEAIYGTTASPFNLLPFHGRATVKGNRLYLFVFDWPSDGELLIPGLRNRIKRATLLGGKKRNLACERDGDGWVVALPAAAPDAVASVIALDLDGPPKVEQTVIRPQVILPALYGPHGQRARLETEDGRVHVGNWINPKDHVSWAFELPKGGTYDIAIDFACAPKSAGSIVVVESGKSTLKAQVPATSGWRDFRVRSLGTLKLKGGKSTLSITVESLKKGAVMNLRGVTLRRLSS